MAWQRVAICGVDYLEMAKVYDSDGFEVVVRSGRANPPLTRRRGYAEDYSGPSCREVAAIIQRTRRSMDASFTDKVKALLLEHFSEWEAIVSYGIGCIGTCSIAQQQLALLLSMASTPRAHKPMISMQNVVSIYDPVLSSEEKAALAELGCMNIQYNEMCRHQTVVPTLYYMPHCGKAMYNNLLWANWSPQQLAKVALIGNSFQNYAERIPERQLKMETPYIYHLLPYCTEQPLPPYAEPTVFNDLSLHTFTQTKLETVPVTTWAHNSPPPLNPADPEMIIS